VTVALVFVLLFAAATYWLITQILPERRLTRLIRPGLGDGLLEALNERRHDAGLPLLEIDPELATVAERKAAHQILTGHDEEGWEYPSEYKPMFGRSLLLEALIAGPAEMMSERLSKQSEIFDEEWVRCGIGVAGGASSQIVVALILCREAWEPAAEGAATLATSRPSV